MPKVPDAIVEMSPVMTLWHYKFSKFYLCIFWPHQDIIDIVKGPEAIP